VTEVKNFLGALEQKMKGVNKAIQDVMGKMSLLEKY